MLLQNAFIHSQRGNIPKAHFCVTCHQAFVSGLLWPPSQLWSHHTEWTLDAISWQHCSCVVCISSVKEKASESTARGVKQLGVHSEAAEEWHHCLHLSYSTKSLFGGTFYDLWITCTVNFFNKRNMSILLQSKYILLSVVFIHNVHIVTASPVHHLCICTEWVCASKC